jgi:hypothetical protein
MSSKPGQVPNCAEDIRWMTLRETDAERLSQVLSAVIKTGEYRGINALYEMVEYAIDHVQKVEEKLQGIVEKKLNEVSKVTIQAKKVRQFLVQYEGDKIKDLNRFTNDLTQLNQVVQEEHRFYFKEANQASEKRDKNRTVALKILVRTREHIGAIVSSILKVICPAQKK